MYLMFDRADTILSGHYFMNDGYAVVDRFSFQGETHKNHVEIKFGEKSGVRKTKGKIQISGDTLTYTFGSKKHATELNFVKQKTSPPVAIRSRYLQPVFAKVRKKEEEYGKARGYYVSKPVDKITTDEYVSIILQVGKELAMNFTMPEQSLKMDIYQPVGDTIKRRPLLMLIHGGAFIIGDKDTETMRVIANYFAERGYVVASINYRLGYVFVPGGYVYLERCIYRAIQDARAALRYLVHHADRLRIDPSYVFIAGNSAGGFTALKTAFMEQHEAYESAAGNVLFLRDDLGCLDCSGNTLKNKFSIKGVINMWGGLTDTSIIDKREKIPVLLFHGDKDEIVPAGHQYPFANISTELSSFFTSKTFGSFSIHEHMQRLGLNSRLIIFPGEGHDPQIGKNNTLNENMKVILENMNDFMYQLIAADSSQIAGKTTFSRTDPTAVFSIKGKGKISARWYVEGGAIVSTNNNTPEIKVVWFSDAQKHSLRCVAINENGFVNTVTREIRITQ